MTLKVLFATDGRAPADRAQKLIEKVADRSRTELTALSVASYELLIPESDYYLLAQPETRMKHSLETAQLAAETLGAYGFVARAKAVEGSPGGKILSEATNGYDLIVLGGGSKRWLGNLLLGSTSTQVLHSSSVSVLIVHEVTQETQRARILLGVDGSDQSKMAGELVALFADPSRCDIKVVSVVSPPLASSAAWDGPTMTTAQEHEILHIRTEQAESAASEACLSLNERGFAVESSVVLGHPASLLLEEGANGGFDLVAVGSTGLGPVRRILLGSVSDHVSRLSSAALVARSRPITTTSE